MYLHIASLEHSYASLKTGTIEIEATLHVGERAYQAGDRPKAVRRCRFRDSGAIENVTSHLSHGDFVTVAQALAALAIRSSSTVY